MALTTITVNKVLASCEAIALSGPTKIVAEDMTENDVVYIYEETGTATNYQQVNESQHQKSILTDKLPSFIFEGYGNYKFLLGADTDVDLVVAYGI